MSGLSLLSYLDNNFTHLSGISIVHFSGISIVGPEH